MITVCGGRYVSYYYVCSEFMPMCAWLEATSDHAMVM